MKTISEIRKGNERKLKDALDLVVRLEPEQRYKAEQEVGRIQAYREMAIHHENAAARVGEVEGGTIGGERQKQMSDLLRTQSYACDAKVNSLLDEFAKSLVLWAHKAVKVEA